MNFALAAAAGLLLVLLMLAERRWPAREFPQVRGWRLLGALFLALFLPVGACVALVLPREFLTDHAVFDLEPLPYGLELLSGFLLSTFAYYWLHRAQHRFHWFWRSGHQLHHAIQRIDLTGTAYLHPSDLFLQIAVNVVACGFVLGLSPEALATVGTIAAICGFFQHLNLKTPRWVALVAQRPEAHCVHHQLGVHGYNYGDFPLWDALFGTFRNPRSWSGIAGFGATPRLGDLLMMRDVAGARI